jgi:uncharacterized Zn finger protein (UPF0148 family)
MASDQSPVHMQTTFSSYSCPRCGAPLQLAAGQAFTICIYCNASIRVAAPVAGQVSAAPSLAVTDVPPEVAARVKELVADGQRAEAVRYYAEQAGITPAEASQAVERLAVSVIWKMTHNLPMNTVGISISLVLIAASLAVLAWSALRVVQGQIIWAIAVFLSLFTLLTVVRWFAPKAVSTLVASQGRLARATILRKAVIKPDLRDGGTLLTLHMEVQPEAGSSFLDQETVLVRTTTVAKLEPGAVIRVRYSPQAPGRVFPVSPIKVWDVAANDFV